MPDLVRRRDRVVPARDERRVMLGNRRKWPAVDAQAARVAEMGVAGEEDHPTSDCRSPSTEIAWPETVRPSGEARKTIMSASCVGWTRSLIEARRAGGVGGGGGGWGAGGGGGGAAPRG